jgi:protein-S-isoprenylcysteine O-methyltransferase Ste14
MEAYSPFGEHHLWSAGPGLAWPMALLCIAGFAFTAWAGLHRAMLWSGSLTGREGLHVIDTGPFSIVRHPVSTGLLLAAVATMVVSGTGEAIAGTGLLLAAFSLKALLEERVLRRQLGADSYGAYARRTPMLVPFAKL